MAAKLVFSYYVDGGIAWFDTEDDEEGATVGQGGTNLEDLRAKYALTTDIEERSFLAVEIAVGEFAAKEPNAEHSVSKGAWVFETGTAQKKALAIAKAADKAERLACSGSTASWPGWARTAVANGWKAPKGWKP